MIFKIFYQKTYGTYIIIRVYNKYRINENYINENMRFGYKSIINNSDFLI